MKTHTQKSSIPRFKKLRANARSIAAEIYTQVYFDHVPLDVAFENAPKLNTLEMRDRGFCHSIVRASLRHSGWLNLALNAQLKKPLPQKAHEVNALLITALAQKLVLKVPLHAVVSETVNLAKANHKTAHMAGLMNAVLRRAEFTNAPALANWPVWLQNSWVESYGEERAENIACACMNEPPLDIALKNNTSEQRAIWAEKLCGEITATGTIRISHAGKIELLEGYEQGAWWVQDMAARIPVLMLGDVNGATVLDLCAAPGGKTAQLIAAGANVIALDKDSKRMTRLKDNLHRLRMKAECVVSDALRYEPTQKFSHIILDAPCSATGTLRKRPDVANNRTPKDIESLSNLQLELLTHAFSLLQDGGVIVYATCSLEYEEGEMVLKQFLADHPNAEVVVDWAESVIATRKASLRVSATNAAICDESHEIATAATRLRNDAEPIACNSSDVIASERSERGNLEPGIKEGGHAALAMTPCSSLRGGETPTQQSLASNEIRSPQQLPDFAMTELNSPLLQLKTSQNFMRCLPCHYSDIGGMDGFFAVKVRRI